MTDATDRGGEAVRALKPFRIKGLGWRPSMPDASDRLFHLPIARKLEDVPPKMDNSGDLPECWDQGQIGDCTSYGTEAGIWQHRQRQGLPPLDASNRFTYYFSRLQLGPDYVTIDSGASVRGAMKVWATLGSCPEAAWPTPAGEWSPAWAEKPPADVVAQAQGDILKGFERVMALAPGVKLAAAMRYAIAKKGGCVFGFPCHASFLSDETAQTGIMPKPGTSSADPIEGGHCTYAVGYDDEFTGANWPDTWRGAILVRNSWGNWGSPEHPGHFWMSYHWINQRGTVSDVWIPEIVA